MDLKGLTNAIDKAAALRRCQTLQPVGGKGDKIFPPTYPPSDTEKKSDRNAPPRHVFEKRRVGDKEIWCVLVDSVQSQANRLEEALLDAIHEGVTIPHVVVDFAGTNLAGVTRITSLDAPHRVYDAILRDSLTSDNPPQAFMTSAIGQRLAMASLRDASALLEISPNALLFGAWHSTGQGGGLGAKFARSLTSEIVAIDVPVEESVDRRTGEISVSTSGRRTGSRMDPLGVLKGITAGLKVYKGASGWDVTKEGAGNGAKEAKPSEINHGNIAPSVQPLGITCDYIEHSFVLSFAALRRLRFGGSPQKDAAGRVLLAALGLLALTEQDSRGYALRSRCDLVCDGITSLELVHSDGSGEKVKIDREGARQLYKAAFDAARKTGFSLSEQPTKLTPQEKLVKIIKASQDLALSGAGEAGDDDGAGTGD